MRRCSNWSRCPMMASDRPFRSPTRRCRAPARRAGPAGAVAASSSGGRSAGSLSQVRLDAVDGKIRADRCGTATTCHSRPLAACTVRIWTRPAATPSSARASRSRPRRRHRGRPAARPPGAPAGGVVGHHVGEPVQVLGAGPAGRDRAGGPDLDVDPEPAAHLGHQIRHRVAEVVAQRGEFASQGGDAAVSGRGVGVLRARVGQCVGQAGGVGVRAAAAMISSAVAAGRPGFSATARRHSAVRSRAPSRHRGPVSTRMAAAPAVGSATSRSIATTSATSGTDSRPPARPPRPGRRARQRRGDGSSVGVAPHQYRGRRRRRSRLRRLGVAAGDVPGDPIAFGGDVGVQRAAHGARFGLGRGSSGRTATERRRASAETALAMCRCSAGCANWCATPGWAPGIRRRAGSRW